jgi:serine/threonine protein kinase
MDSLTSYGFPIFKADNIEWGEKLGEGAGGIVFRCQYDNQEYAVKEYRKRDWDKMYPESKRVEEIMLNDIKNELRISQKLSGLDKTVQVKGVSYDASNGIDNIYIFMELLSSNGDFHDYLQDTELWEPSRKYNDTLVPSPCSKYIIYNHDDNLYWSFSLNTEKKIKLGHMMIESIVEIHNRGVLHCDIKPSNMMLHDSDYENHDPILKMIDYGASHIATNNGIMDIYWTPGTEGYRAPEQDTKKVGYKSDIYSVGVCLIELWVGEIWFDCYGFKLCRNEVLKNLRIIEKENMELGNLLRKCISLNYNNRPSGINLLKLFNKLFQR